MFGLRRYLSRPVITTGRMIGVTKAEVDTYIAAFDEPRRSTLEALRAAVLRVIPDAEQGISYGAPVFKLGGKNVAGLLGAKNHISYLPHSGSVLDASARPTGQGLIMLAGQPSDRLP